MFWTHSRSLLLENEMWRQTGAMRLTTNSLTAVSSVSVGVQSSSSSVCFGTPLSLKRRFFMSGKRARSLLITSTLNTSTSPGGDSSGGAGRPFGFGTTRLGRVIGAGQREFSNRFKNARKKFPLKIFLLLLGYYMANALATILGQTGDWDVLAAGILVALIEGIGYLMYRVPSVLGERGEELVVCTNFWKSGFSFGLFVDAFKLGS